MAERFPACTTLIPPSMIKELAKTVANISASGRISQFHVLKNRHLDDLDRNVDELQATNDEDVRFGAPIFYAALCP